MCRGAVLARWVQGERNLPARRPAARRWPWGCQGSTEDPPGAWFGGKTPGRGSAAKRLTMGAGELGGSPVVMKRPDVSLARDGSRLRRGFGGQAMPESAISRKGCNGRRAAGLPCQDSACITRTHLAARKAPVLPKLTSICGTEVGLAIYSNRPHDISIPSSAQFLRAF